MKTSYSRMLTNVMPVILDLIPDYVDGMTAISRIHVLEPFRNLGYGTDVMREVTKDADREGITLCLEINSYGPLNYDDLQHWYEGFGFAISDRPDRPGLFVREPKDHAGNT